MNTRNSLLTVGCLCLTTLLATANPKSAAAPRAGKVRVAGHSLVDENGPFLGLGVSYLNALWRCKHDRARFERDLAFLSSCGFNYYRMVSMVGYYPAWNGLEIAPVSFKNREGKYVEAWPDYCGQLRDMIDIAYDHYGLRTQITIFADAQLIPEKPDRIDHMHRLLDKVVPGREHKIILLEVANEAWQNGFPGDEGVADLREFAQYLADRTDILVAITSNHDHPELGSPKAFEQVYANSAADIATWHFTRDRHTDAGWKTVYHAWDFGFIPGLPPVSSNEPIGPGSSVDSESDPIKLVMAAAFAYTAKLPMYVFHSGAGVFGKTRFEETPAINQYKAILRLLPPDLPNWERHDAKQPEAPFTTFAGGEPNRYAPELASTNDGCVRHIGSRKDNQFVTIPIGIRSDGLTLEARRHLTFTVHHPLTGEPAQSATLEAGERITLPAGPGAWLLLGELK
jgi:hypothetical protein